MSVVKKSMMVALAIALSGAAGAAMAEVGPAPIARSPSDTTAGIPASGVIATEMEARTRLEAQGYRNIGPLVRGTDGMWRGAAIRGAASVTVAVGAGGRITAL